MTEEDFDKSFEEEDVEDDSDNESVISDIYEDHSLDDWISGTNKFKEFENACYTLEGKVPAK